MDRSFKRLFEDIRACKTACTCPGLRVRSYYFEPNPETASLWVESQRFTDGLDRRVVFVGESPGPQSSPKHGLTVRQCWREDSTPQNRRFRAILNEYGLEHCHLTNSVKCGVRRGGRHTDDEIESCSQFLIRELELIKPLVAVGVGGNAMHALRLAIQKMADPPVLHRITHYSARGNPHEPWTKEFPELMRLLSRLKPR